MQCSGEESTHEVLVKRFVKEIVTLCYGSLWSLLVSQDISFFFYFNIFKFFIFQKDPLLTNRFLERVPRPRNGFPGTGTIPSPTNRYLQLRNERVGNTLSPTNGVLPTLKIVFQKCYSRFATDMSKKLWLPLWHKFRTYPHIRYQLIATNINNLFELLFVL